MQISKLGLTQWLRLCLTVLPLIGGIVRASGAGVVVVIRSLIDLVAQVETLFPPEIDPATGKPRKRGAEKLAAFRDLVISGFATAADQVEQVQEKLGDLDAIAKSIVSLFNEWKLLPNGGA